MGKKHFMFMATEDNDGVTNQATGDYSVTPAVFKVAPDTSQIVDVHRVIVSIEDATINDGDAYGGLGALTNGITFGVYDGSDNLLDLLTPFPIKTNGQWGAVCYDIDLIAGFATGDDFLNVRWTFTRSGAPVRLDKNDGQYIGINLNDNFTGLISHQFFFQGYYINESY